jgi:quaternary ammonium compound-resistance protein SugE
VGLKYTNGFSQLRPSLLVLVFIASSILLLSLSMRTLPASTAYAVWTGIGVLGAVLLEVGFLGGRLTVARGVLLLMLVVAVVGLRFTADPAPAAPAASAAR